MRKNILIIIAIVIVLIIALYWLVINKDLRETSNQEFEIIEESTPEETTTTVMESDLNKQFEELEGLEVKDLENELNDIDREMNNL